MGKHIYIAPETSQYRTQKSWLLKEEKWNATGICLGDVKKKKERKIKEKGRNARDIQA